MIIMENLFKADTGALLELPYRGEGANLYGRRDQKKGRERRQINSKIQKESYRFWSYSGGSGSNPLQISR